ncbi:SDR family NAD(P)-dependent oxidoreductase [Roseobacter denitrificans]|uniref:Oxidoreductase, putative n=1 Tax=Roseobacter denitrificans (strain ATCC 33942 / OCh 114) TaxID=375451 RepID=Q160J4_ROSDO|nr:SDR family oxidoreductase [Roseobacter denitrificans]ABG33599.1 oxidoreductase, putative [Roseobacter denitrificans OCh 114]AVL52900.1 SDR family NAD(P)-dependent oxidoreductase [Roseobacter denitrificans]SFG03830.1 NAD(P)-dependent dehydrogenase, short-chain alcohol dehydrogenase family [Roseobacter denitrificans OCh 114]
MSKNRNAPALPPLPGVAGQHVLITAGASGIGFAIAQELHAQGARVAICDVDRAALAHAADSLTGCLACHGDVTDAGAMDAVFGDLMQRFGQLDVLVNNAGIAGPTAQIEDISEEEWRACLDVCLTGQYMATRRAVPLLKAAGGGAIVNMSSAAGKHGYAYRTPYSAAKFGVIGLTQSLAKELGPHNIRVNAILPGFVEGPRMDGVIARKAEVAGLSVDAMRDEYLAAVSLRRMVSAQDVARTVCFLVSDAGANLSGQSLAVDGNVEYLT